MFAVGLDVDKLVSTELFKSIMFYSDSIEREKILLYAGNSSISSPLVFITLGKIYLICKCKNNKNLPRQSAGNFSFSRKVSTITKNTYNSYTNLPNISEHRPIHNSSKNLNDNQFGYFLAGLIEGDGWFGKKELHIIFFENDISLAYFIKKRIGYKLSTKAQIFNTSNRGSIRQMSTVATISNPKSTNLNPFWVTGFTDGDGSFHLAIIPNPKFRVGYQVRFTFSIWLKKEDKVLLEKIKTFFGVGKVYPSGSEGFVYQVISLKDLNLIIHHFEVYTLVTQKWADYHLFKQALDIVKRKEHLTYEGLLKLVELKASMNLGLNYKLEAIFGKKIKPVFREIPNSVIPNKFWLSGFTSAEGLFFVVSNKSQLSKLGVSVRLNFEISQHLRDEKLMKNIINYLDCGRITFESSQSLVKFIVSKNSDIAEKIIPLFNSFPILGSKSKDFEDFCKVSNLINSKIHLTQEGLDKILRIKAGMNKGRQLSDPYHQLIERRDSNKNEWQRLKSNNIFKRKYTTFRALAIGNQTSAHSNLITISEHVPKHNSNLNDEDFGYFLSGLIEGCGWFDKDNLQIIFGDISLAYFIKKRIGYGSIYKIKNKKAVRYICKNYKGLFIILSLINGKIVSKPKFEQLIKNDYNNQFNIEILPPSNKVTLDNHWLAGFTQADGCFHISIVKSKTHKTGFSVRLEYYIKQNDMIPLKLLYDYIKLGNLSHYSNGIWCYKSTGFKTAALLIQYFDNYNLFADKYIQYIKFRKIYIMITKGLHLDNNGIKKIISIKTKGSSETSTQEI